MSPASTGITTRPTATKRSNSSPAFTKSPKEVLDSYFATGSDYYRDPNGCVPAIAIQKPIDAMVEENLIPQPVDVSKYLV